MGNINEKITCCICKAEVHSIQIHLRDHHAGMSLEHYQTNYPDAPVLSEFAKSKLAERLGAQQLMQKEEVKVEHIAVPQGVSDTVKRALHEAFNLGGGGRSNSGKPIGITCVVKTTHPELVPDIDPDYVFDVELLKDALLAIEDEIPLLLWGHAGTGKTTLLEQISARTGRPFMRVQHTPNSEETHFLGQWVLRDGHTLFQLGPLAEAMLYGWVYCADEYDVARTEVNTVYQAVLEGKPLVIKDADPEHRVIRPHPNFRFVATGNTNGTGDETGLYQGTNLGNAANYGRFGMKLKCHYQEKASESAILQKKCGLLKEDADRLIEFATMVREAYDAGKISSTIDTRILIYAANIGIKRGSFRKGLTLSFTNGLSRIDQEVAEALAQRLF